MCEIGVCEIGVCEIGVCVGLIVYQTAPFTLYIRTHPTHSYISLALYLI